MSNATTTPRTKVGSTGLFLWNAGLWVVFFGLMQGQHLDNVAGLIRALPLPAEILVWLVLFPWVAATMVWTSGWWEDVRVTFVAFSAIAWTLLAIPRTKTPLRAGRRPPH